MGLESDDRTNDAVQVQISFGFLNYERQFRDQLHTPCTSGRLIVNVLSSKSCRVTGGIYESQQELPNLNCKHEILI